MAHEHVFDTAIRVGATYHRPLSDADRAKLLNTIAYIHRDDGWGLSAKPSGRHILHVDGSTWIAEDILHHRDSNHLFDVIRGDDEAIVWQDKGVPQTPDRIWVGPVPPVDTPVNPVDTPVTPTDLVRTLDKISGALAQQGQRLTELHVLVGSLAEMVTQAPRADRLEFLTDLVVRRVASEAQTLQEHIEKIKARLLIR